MPISTVTDPSTPLNTTIQSIEFYEAAIALDETKIDNYWYLGLSYLLADRVDDIQPTWFIPFGEANEAEIEIYTEELLTILEREAIYRETTSDIKNAWSIRQQIWLIKPNLVENILELIALTASQSRLTEEDLIDFQLTELLETVTIGTIDDELLEKTIAVLVRELQTELSLNLIQACLQLTGSMRLRIIDCLVIIASQLFYQHKLWLFAVRLTEICQHFSPVDLDILQFLTKLYSGIDSHSQAIAIANKYYQLATDRLERLFGNYLVQHSYLLAGNWDGYLERIDRHHQLLTELVTNPPQTLSKEQYPVIVSSYLAPYLADNPRTNRNLQNKLAAFYQSRIEREIVKYTPQERGSLAKLPSVIRIGYLASTLRAHSVGWLSRWLFHYHDRQSFQVFIYCLNQSANDPFNHQWFRDKVDVSYYFDVNYQQVVSQIQVDEIDILIDLDSLTFDTSCLIMAHKPAPVQATWLGLDATGLPAIDYFIVDPYVLPNDAQAYYHEKLWRLPQTYLAVDGFEVGIPTLQRQDLDIPADAIVYFSSQSGYKRHPDNIRTQLRILNSVPNSYLLIKGKSDPDMVRNLFGKIGDEEGVSLDRLRFLPGVRDESTHRANLAIADIVLDTFPYNGATTTLETLWMGIPMVTQVGEQFAARNSYTFMLNAGITEGIAWSEAEYIDWGIRLGLEPQLRLEIREKLRSGRQTAPVWNAKQFTLDMEQAYRDMWAIYQQQLRSLAQPLEAEIEPHENN